MNLERKGKVFLWTGVIMLALAGGVWVANGGIGRIKTALADTRTGTCSTPGCFSEEWVADEMFGLYRLGLYDDGEIEDNGWVSATGVRDCVVDDTPYLGEDRYHSSNLVANNSASIGSATSCGYETNVWAESIGGAIGPGALDARYTSTVTKWTVNGHVH